MAAAHEPTAHDWKTQRQRLDTHCDAREPEDAVETYVGYLASKSVGPLAWCCPQDGVGEGVYVALLRRYGRPNRPAVLIVPGATAWRGTFFEPEGGLIRHLKHEFDVWTLDWRGTKVITDLWRGRPRRRVPAEIADMTLCAIADTEIAGAVRFVRERRADGRTPALLGHCIGAGVTALSIARGNLAPQPAESLGRPRVVLSTLGLFYRGGVDTWLRGHERVDQHLQVDPRAEKAWCLDFAVDRDRQATPWPPVYDQLYEMWTKTPYPHCASSFCRRMSSIIGTPYRPDDIGYLHADERQGLAAQFGLLPLSLLDDIGRAVRQGLIRDHAGEHGRLRDNLKAWEWTLLTGDENQLWHRDSIDRMYEWLRREAEVGVEKRVFERFGHQDLWWSPRAKEAGSVYDYVAARLAGTSP